MEPGWVPAFLAAAGYAAALGVGWLVDDPWASATSFAELFRAFAIHLMPGTVFLVAFVQWLNWETVWRDQRKLEMTTLFKWVAGLAAVTSLSRVDGAYGSDILPEALWWMAAVALLIGFNEELLFRGIWLRAMRVNGRGEGRVAIYTALAFGLFHITNILLNTPGAGFGQVFHATVIGFALYLWRRGTTWVFPAMLIHALWNFAIFVALYDLSPSEAGAVVQTNLILIGALCTSAVAAERIWKGEKKLVWQRAGAAIDSDAPLMRIDAPAVPATSN
jgi:membrane protease YdiL (CAAX protease family)